VLFRSGKEALDAIQNANNSFDLVFLDVQMPVMDGLEASREINRIYGKSKPYLVAITANAMKEDRIACLEAGMDHYISKPFQISEVAEVIVNLQNQTAIAKTI